MESRSVTCYPQPGKRKALDVCEAFAAGVRACGGRATVATAIPDRLLPGEAVFYGVRPAWKHLWDQAVAEGRTRWYIDNGYFQRPPPDRADVGYFRVCRNAVQAAQSAPAYERLKALGVHISPERRGLNPLMNVLVAQQSDEFMATWADGMDMAAYAHYRWASQPLVLREKSAGRPLMEDLALASVVVSWSSNVLVEAVLDGREVDVHGESVAQPFDHDLGQEWPDRREWAARLAGSQWTAGELAQGKAWRSLAHA